jgi:hypothetical protein
MASNQQYYYVTTLDALRQSANLFHPSEGAKYTVLGTSGYVYVNAAFSKDSNQSLWHARTDVGRMWDIHDPSQASNTLSSLTSAGKNFTSAHLSALGNIGLSGSNTMTDAHTTAVNTLRIGRALVQY